MTGDSGQQRLKLENGSDTWEMLYDRAAGIPAVLLAKNYVNSAASLEYYVRAPGGELLAGFTDGETPTPRYYHFDYLGSTRLLTALVGENVVVADKYAYDAYGALLARLHGQLLCQYRER